jgi:hypothetical protein
VLAKALRQRRVRILALTTPNPDQITTADAHLPCCRCGTPCFIATCDDCAALEHWLPEPVHQGEPPTTAQKLEAAYGLRAESES